MNEKLGKKIFLDRWMQPVYTHIIKFSQNHLLHVIGILEELQLEKPDDLMNTSRITLPSAFMTT